MKHDEAVNSKYNLIDSNDAENSYHE